MEKKTNTKVVLTGSSESGIEFEVKNDMGKADEIRILCVLRDAFKALGNGNSYLGSLFSEKLVDFAVAKIQDDICPDVMDWLDRSKEIDELTKCSSNYQAQVRRADNLEASLERQREMDAKVLESKTATIDALEDNLRLLNEEHMNLHDKWQLELTSRRDLEKQILALKAKLYDMLMEKEAAHV